MNLRSTLVRQRWLLCALVCAALLVIAGNASAQFDLLASQFGSLAERGRHPNAGLIRDEDGNYYGTTSAGGEFGNGTVFKITPDETLAIILHSFSDADGAHPRAPVVEYNGMLYGTTSQGGAGGVGTVFTLAKDGTGFTVLHSLPAWDSTQQCFPEGAGINAPLVPGANGLYGVVASGGCSPNTNAAFFRIDPTAADPFHIVEYVPDTGADSGLVRGTDGFFYGTTLGQSFGKIYRIGEDGNPPEVLYSLTREDGFGHDLIDLIQAEDGTLYGTASSGGTSACGAESCGTVFRFDPITREYHTMHSFGLDDPAGRYPSAGLVEGKDGFLYGTTSVTTPSGADCCGAIFRINPFTDVIEVLHTFTGDFNGSSPRGRLIEASRGHFLGTTYWGGVGGDSGVVFLLTVGVTTSTSLAAVPATSVFGESVALTATVSSADGVPTGLVEFFDGDTSLAVVGLSGGEAVLSTAALSVGSHSIKARYLGDEIFPESDSLIVVVTVSVAPTTTNLDASTGTSVFGQTVSFTATVSSAGGDPTGDVEFFDGATSLGKASLSGGQAVLATTALGLGGHTISARYLGDDSFQESGASSVSVTVSPAQTTTTLVTSPNPSSRRQTVTLTATVAAVAPSSGIASGQVQFLDGKKKLGTATLENGIATLSVSFNNMGSHDLTATYAGDGNFIGSSAASTHTVNR